MSQFSDWPGFDGDLPPNEAPVVPKRGERRGLRGLPGRHHRACAGAPRPARLAPLCFLVVASFLVVNKVWSPQYSLWLVPATMLSYLGTDKKGLPTDWFLGTVLVRDAVVVALRPGGAHRARAGAGPVRATVGEDPDWLPAAARVAPVPAAAPGESLPTLVPHGKRRPPSRPRQTAV